MLSDHNTANTITPHLADNMNSISTSTLAEIDRSSAPTPSFLEPEKDRAAAGLSDGSTRAPSTDLDIEKRNNGGETDTDTVVAETRSPPEGDYPEGFRLGMIVLALIMAVFLVSLDMVSLPLPSNAYPSTD